MDNFVVSSKNAIQEDSYLYMDNALIMSQQHMTATEAKIIRLAILQIANEDTELRTYRIPIIELAELLNVDRNGMYREIRNICDRLLKRTVTIKNNDPKQPWLSFQWINRAEYDGIMVSIKISEEIKEYVTQLRGFFTRYDYYEIRPLTSFYSLRLFELITLHFNKCHHTQHYFTFDLDYLKSILCQKDEYKRINRFKERVLEPSIKEINLHTNLEISYELIKEGRSYKSVRFKVSSKKAMMDGIGKVDQSKEKGYLDIIGIQSILKSTGLDHTFDIAKSVYKAYGNDISRLMNNIIYLSQRTDVGNRIGYLITISKDDPQKGIVKPAVKKEKKSKPKNDKINDMCSERQRVYEDMEKATKEPDYIKNLFDWSDEDQTQVS